MEKVPTFRADVQEHIGGGERSTNNSLITDAGPEGISVASGSGRAQSTFLSRVLRWSER